MHGPSFPGGEPGSRRHLLLCGFALAAAACASPPPAPDGTAADGKGCEGTPAVGGEMVIGGTTEPQDLLCLRATDSVALALCRVFSGTLIDHDRSLGLVPRLARSYEVSEDGLTITFRLREDALWHDGEPFTSRDVLYTVGRIRDPDSTIRGTLPALFDRLAGIEAPDDHTVVARYREPFALALQAWTAAFIVPAHLPFEPGGQTPLSRAPVGTGPFRVTSWETGVRIVMEANEAYFEGRPLLDRLVYRVVPDRRSLLVGLRTGDIDVTGLGPTEAPAESDDLPFTVVLYPANSLDFIMWNTRAKARLFADPGVRRALSLAFDRQAYIDDIAEGHDLPAVSTFHPVSWAHDPGLAPLPYDPGEAARLLREAGWRDTDGDGNLDTPSGPAEFTLLYYSGLTVTETIASLLKESLEKLGIVVHLQGLDFPTLKERVTSGSFDAAVYRWGMDVDPDPFDFFSSPQTGAGQNYGGYSNPEVDRLAEEGRRTLKTEQRTAIYHRIERILRDEQPYTFIAHPVSAVGVSRRVCGLEVGPGGFWGWYPAPLRWWMDPGLPRR